MQSDARVVAATKPEPAGVRRREVSGKSVFRLAVMVVMMPALQERADDIPAGEGFPA